MLILVLDYLSHLIPLLAFLFFAVEFLDYFRQWGVSVLYVGLSLPVGQWQFAFAIFGLIFLGEAELALVRLLLFRIVVAPVYWIEQSGLACSTQDTTIRILNFGTCPFFVLTIVSPVDYVIVPTVLPQYFLLVSLGKPYFFLLKILSRMLPAVDNVIDFRDRVFKLLLPIVVADCQRLVLNGQDHCGVEVDNIVILCVFVIISLSNIAQLLNNGCATATSALPTRRQLCSAPAYRQIFAVQDLIWSISKASASQKCIRLGATPSRTGASYACTFRSYAFPASRTIFISKRDLAASNKNHYICYRKDPHQLVLENKLEILLQSFKPYPSYFAKDPGDVKICDEIQILLSQVSYMDLTETKRPKKVYEVIEPNTTRVLEMRRIKEEKEREQAQMQEKMRKIKQEEQRKRWVLDKMKDQQKKLQLKRREEEERRKREEQAESNTLTGRFGHMINDLNTNTTNLEFTTSGMDLRPAQIKVLISNVQNNSSLKGLTMCRKRLTDAQGKQVSDKLSTNQFLQRLELEGNHLGPQSLFEIARLMKTNQSIRLIDLQGNNLVKGDNDQRQNYRGVDALVEALKVNQTLLSLNLNKTGLDAHASRKLAELMEVNTTLILLDIENNPDMDIKDVTKIQDALIRNKQDYDDERYMEFIERKRMRRQEDISGVLLLNQQTKKLRSQAIQLNIKTKKAQLDDEWTDFLVNEQLKRQKQIIRMEKEAATKKGKKKKK